MGFLFSWNYTDRLAIIKFTANFRGVLFTELFVNVVNFVDDMLH